MRKWQPCKWISERATNRLRLALAGGTCKLPVRYMSRTVLLAAVLTGLSLDLLNAGAEAVVEGVVPLPKSTVSIPNTSRYQNKIVGDVGPPDLPVAVVYLDGLSSSANATNRESAKMDQKKFQFAPGILAIQKGTAVEFPNLDDTYHNVFSYSKTKRFDLGRYRKDEKPPALVFDKTGVVKLFCEIHEHMRGTIVVLDTPFFVKTDPAGRFRLAHLPAGRFTLKAWVNENTTLERPVELPADGLVRVDFPTPR
jgi:plastocyanin